MIGFSEETDDRVEVRFMSDQVKNKGHDLVLRKLHSMQERQGAIQRELEEAGATGNPARIVELSRENGRLEKSLVLYRAYRKLEREAAEAQMISQDTSEDVEFRHLAESQWIELKDRMEQLLEQILAEFLAGQRGASDSMMLEIRAGTGGDEAALFARDLAEMYRRYSEKNNWRFDVLDFSPTEQGGFREIIVNVRGTGAVELLAMEGGGHRVQRVPQTETQGRIHTSAATVAVLPEPDQSAIEINPADVREDVSRAGGPGGQNVNKVESAVQLTHIPTGLVVRMREERSQHKNRDKAWRILRSRVFEFYDQQRRAARSDARREMIGSGDRNERIRTYNFPQNRLTDHRLNRNFPLEKIVAGDMSELLLALRDRSREQWLESMLDA
ncbi:MAG: peptide chain release factor 1 [Planctomycetes bacterium]|nr:peptide chain release factor 1 [Planctomycetota bacterium]